MADSPHDRFVVDAHVHFDPDEAEHVVEIMEANCISRVVNLHSSGARHPRG